MIKPKGLLLTVAAGAIASGAFAQDLPPLTGKDVKVRIDSPANVQFYPRKARQAGVEGKATTLCTVAKNGRLSECTVIDETPAGCAFADAALKLNRYMVIAPLAKDGTSTVGRAFKFELTLKLPDGELPRANSCD